ncbi:MAG: TRAP transporter large permease [Candidatus Atribacteria bacterium]|nr:TRAP transporter large permease [Candidatus Atribacteria bacterium]
MLIFSTILILIITLVIGVSIPFAFGSALIFYIITKGISPAFLIPNGYSKIANLVLLCIPLFILGGTVMKRGKVGDALVGFVEQFVGRFKGGLGAVTIIACALFGAVCGSSSATLSSIGSIMQPKLAEKGYPRGIGASIIANSSVLGLLIPPSAAQVIYAWSGGQSVAACFLATVIPGIILVILFSIVQYFMVRNIADIKVLPKLPREKFYNDFKQKTVHAFPALLMPVIILGGIYGGIMTPMESAAVGVIYCIPIGFYFYKGLTIKNLGESIMEAANTTGAVMLMLMSAMLFSRILIMERTPDQLLNILINISPNKYFIILMVNLIMVFCGMLMDDGSAIMLCTPLLLPIASGIGIHPIQFAAILGVNLGMGLVTPPVAPMLYFGSQIGKSPISEMIMPTMKFILFAWIPTLILTTIFPQISLTLPRLILGLKF